jgi:hypothetical protein
MNVLITLTTAGADTGPFNLYSNTDSYVTAFQTNIAKSLLVAGYTSTVVPAGTTTVRVKSTGLCTTYVDLFITGSGGTTTTTTTPYVGPTTTTTTTPYVGPATTTTTTTGGPTTTTTTTGGPTTTTTTTGGPTTTTTTTTTIAPPVATNILVTANSVYGPDQDCLGTPYSVLVTTATATLYDQYGNPKNAASTITVTINTTYQPCYGGSSTSPINITINAGSSSGSTNWDASKTVDCGGAGCLGEYQTYDCAASNTASLPWRSGTVSC